MSTGLGDVFFCPSTRGCHPILEEGPVPKVPSLLPIEKRSMLKSVDDDEGPNHIFGVGSVSALGLS